MYDNIGKKIKTLAKVICYIGIGSSCLVGFLMIIGGIGSSSVAQDFGSYAAPALAGAGVFGGVIYALVGSLVSWLGTLMLYGFGHLVDMQEESAAALDELCDLMRRKNTDHSKPPLLCKDSANYGKASSSAVSPSEVAKIPAWKLAEEQAAARQEEKPVQQEEKPVQQEEKPVQQEKFCPVCGCKLAPTSSFCYQCGNKV